MTESRESVTLRRKIVLAGNRRQFVQWCQDEGISLRRYEGREVVDASNTRGLLGQQFGPYDQFLLVGTWYDRRDIEQIVEALVTRTRGDDVPKGWTWVTETWDGIVRAREERWKLYGPVSK